MTERGPERRARTWSAPIELPSGVEPIGPPGGFADRLAELGVELEPGEAEALARYAGLLLAANRAVNLTAVRTADELWLGHLADALALLPVLASTDQDAAESGRGPTLIDVGSGGGLPGLVLAIVRPDAEVTLLDATAKKCRFLEHAARELGLGNVSVVHARAESAGQRRGVRADRGGVAHREGGLRGVFDVVTARAVGRLATLAELTVPFARVGGLIALVKGARAGEELDEAKGALHLLHAGHAGTVETPTGRIVVLEKRRETPKGYPRADGVPKREPLGV